MLNSTNSCLHEPLYITTSLTFFLPCFFSSHCPAITNKDDPGILKLPSLGNDTTKEAPGSGRCCPWLRSVFNEHLTQQPVRADPNVSVPKLLAKAVLFCAGEPVFPAWANRFWKRLQEKLRGAWGHCGNGEEWNQALENSTLH